VTGVAAEVADCLVAARFEWMLSKKLLNGCPGAVQRDIVATGTMGDGSARSPSQRHGYPQRTLV
jgi:hypothetical protein